MFRSLSKLALLTLLIPAICKAGPPVIFNGANAKFINSGTIQVPGIGSAGVCKVDNTGLFSSNATTSDLPEGTNLYYTTARFNSAFSGKTTTDLAEGSNLYFTNSRARTALSATSPISYDNTTGIFSLGTVGISNGGTGQTTANTAFNALAPSQTSQSGLFLTTDGSNTSWASVPGGTMPTASSTTLVSTTSATTTFVTAITTSITTTATSAPVFAKCVLDMTSATAASVAKMRVTINAVAGGTVTESLTTATTQHLTVPNHYLSASLGPGTYTINCDFARNSGTGTVTISSGDLSAVAYQGANSNGITQLTGALQAGPGSGSQALTGTLPIANGGTNQTSAAVNGAVIYSTASAYGYTAAGSTGQILRSAGAASPTWTTETFPSTTTINQILYSSAANVVSGLATVNTGALVTSSTGVPSITSGATANRLLRTNGTTVSFAQANLTSDVTGTLPFGNGGTGATTLASGRVPYSTGSALATDPAFLFDVANLRFTVGTGGGSAKVNAVVASGSDLGLQTYCEGTNNCVQVRNNAAYNLALLNANDANTLGGVLIGAERSRGTQTSRTQAKNGDGELNFIGTCYTGAGSSTGSSASIQYVLSEDCTSSANGGEIVFNTTPNTTTAVVERMRIKQSGEVTLVNTHLKSTQTTAPTASADSSAGTGSTCTLDANATDTKGQASITTGTLGISTGAYCTVTFNKTHIVAPICIASANTDVAALLSPHAANSSTTAFDISFAVAGGISTSYVINYHCIE